MDKELLQRYVEGNVSEEEIETVIDWLDNDEANIRELMALHKLYDISLFNKPEAKNKSAKTEGLLGNRIKKITIELLKVAAIFFMFSLVSELYLNKPKETNDSTNYQTLFIPAGQRAELILPDNTKVWLNAKTKLTYPVSFGNDDRTVTLDGEAYFDVRRNEKQPFVVKTKSLDVKVLGTEFNIIAYSELGITDVALLKGSVDLNTVGKGSDKPYKLNINEHAVLRNGKINISLIDDYEYFKWKEGLLCFNNETVEFIIEKLQLYYDVKIVIENKQLLKHKYNGKFRTKDGVEQVLKVLQHEHKFTYTKDNELNIITIK